MYSKPFKIKFKDLVKMWVIIITVTVKTLKVS